MDDSYRKTAEYLIDVADFDSIGFQNCWHWILQAMQEVEKERQQTKE